MQSLKFVTGNGQNALGECTILSPSYSPPIYVFPWPLRVSFVIPLPCFLASPCKVTNMTISINGHVFSMVMWSQSPCILRGDPPATKWYPFHSPMWWHGIGGILRLCSVQWVLIGQSWKTYLPTFQKQFWSGPCGDGHLFEHSQSICSKSPILWYL